MSRFWNPDVRDLKPYSPGEQPSRRHSRGSLLKRGNLEPAGQPFRRHSRASGNLEPEGQHNLGEWIKLNTNELPYGPSPKALQAHRDAADDSLRLYPDYDSANLRDAWAQVAGVRPTQVFPGNGSDEVLAHAFRALFRRDAPVLFPDVCYSFYPSYCALFGLNYREIPVDDAFRIRLQDYPGKAAANNAGIVFPNPNAPTGIAVELDAVRDLLQRNRDTVVLVDEAYVDFGAESAAPLVPEFPNLLVVQTLSKSRGLAGLRVGAAFGQEELIDGLNRVKNSFNAYPLSRPAQAAAAAALKDAAWFAEIRAKLLASRTTLAAGLESLGFQVLPSAANFVFTRHPKHSGPSLQTALRERGILIRRFDAPRIEDYLRITIGTETECAAVLAALKSAVQR